MATRPLVGRRLTRRIQIARLAARTIMGIRFFCPKGHRIHVKTALAGKKGFCPDCGDKVRIPLASDPNALRKNLAPTNQVNGAHGDQAVTLPGASPQLDDTPSVSIRRDNSDSSIDLRGSLDAKNAGAKSAVLEDASGPPIRGGTTTASNGASAPTGPDPIDENPSAQWYVRPVAGGQFGPAKGPTMRKWLSDGRVGSDSYVWREGWTDWRVASELFPGLPGEKPSDKAGPPPSPGVGGPGSAISSPAIVKAVTPAPRPRKKDSSTTLWIVIGLAVACAILGGVILFLALKK